MRAEGKKANPVSMIPLRIYDPRILAIDLRHRRFGYAVYEGHRNLLDWGVRVYPAVGDVEAAMMRQRLDGLIKLFSPSAIVVTQERWDRGQTSPHIRALDQAMLRAAAQHSIQIRAINQAEVKRTFQNLGCETKYEIATSLSRIFPELAWELPPPRRTWEPEYSRMTTFDAIALGLAYWQQESTEIFVPD